MSGSIIINGFFKATISNGVWSSDDLCLADRLNRLEGEWNRMYGEVHPTQTANPDGYSMGRVQKRLPHLSVEFDVVPGELEERLKEGELPPVY